MHTTLLSGFRDIQDKEALAWSLLDSKSEGIITAAIAAAINRAAGMRVAHIEFPPRHDLVILNSPLPHRPKRHLDAAQASIRMVYEAKAEHCFAYSAARIAKRDPYLGGNLNRDIVERKLRYGTGAGLKYLYEVAHPNRHLKYFTGDPVDVDDAVAALEGFITDGTLAARESIDCGTVDGTHVKIHLCVFDPLHGKPHP